MTIVLVAPPTKFTRLSKLHVVNGLSAALEESNNGYFDLIPVRAYLDHI